MHRALLLEEIQRYIFNEIRLTTIRNDLTALAITCRAFTDTALDALWYELDTIARLIQCMPRDLYLTSSDHFYMALCRPISSSDWAIFQKYAPRVRSVLVSSYHAIETSVFLGLCSPSAPNPLLPNLTSLQWLIWTDAHVLTLRQLVSPSLTSLDLGFLNEPGYPTLDPELEIPFDKSCPSLRDLRGGEEEGFPANLKLVKGLKRSLSQLQRLDTVKWRNLDGEAINSLAQLPALTCAEFVMPSDLSTYIGALPSRSPPLRPPFSKVRDLSIGCESLGSAIAFFNYFALIDLEKLSLGFETEPQSTSTPAGYLFAAIASSLPRNINHLHIAESSQHLHRPRPHTQFIGIQEFRPLLQFNNLQHFDLELYDSIILDDATLLAMADAWPNISTLSLNDWSVCMRRTAPFGGSYVTPSAFIEFLGRCPKLTSLNIPFDFSAIDHADFDPFSIPGLREARHTRNCKPLRRLTFEPYDVVHPDAVAAFLACLVPDATWMTMFQPRYEIRGALKSQDGWDKALSLWKSAQKDDLLIPCLPTT